MKFSLLHPGPLLNLLLLMGTGIAGLAQPGAPKTPEMSATDSLVSPELIRLARLYRLDSATLASFDKIITFKREVYVGHIQNVTYGSVLYMGATDSITHIVSRSHISQILYANGRRDVFTPLDDARVKQKHLVDTARIIIRNQSDWMKVKVTEDPEEVANLRNVGDLKVKYEADIGNMSNEEMMRHASLLLKKKAAALRAHCVLVETKFYHKAYGDLPQLEVTAIAYGYPSSGSERKN
jgi:hypothetical protein